MTNGQEVNCLLGPSLCLFGYHACFFFGAMSITNMRELTQGHTERERERERDAMLFLAKWCNSIAFFKKDMNFIS